MKIYIIAKDSEYKKEKTKDKINHYTSVNFGSDFEQKFIKYQNKFLSYSSIVKLYKDYIKNDPDAVLIFSDIQIFFEGKDESDIESKSKLFISFIHNKRDMRFINTPCFDTRLFYKNFNDEQCKTAFSIVLRQIKELRKKEESDRQFIGKQTSKGINQTKEKSGGILQKRVYITKKRKVILDFMLGFFDTKKELPNYEQFKNYIELCDSVAYEESILFCDVPLSEYPFNDIDPENIAEFKHISTNTYKKYLDIAEAKIAERYNDELQEMGITITDLW